MYTFRHVADELLFGSITILRLYSTTLGYLRMMARDDGQVLLSQYQVCANEPKNRVYLLKHLLFAKLILSLDYNLFVMLDLSMEMLFLWRNVLSHESSFKKKPTQVYKKEARVQKDLIVTQSISDKYCEIGCHNTFITFCSCYSFHLTFQVFSFH